MNIIEFNAFGKKMKRFTFLTESSSIEAIKQICPTAEGFLFARSENLNLSCPVSYKRDRRGRLVVSTKFRSKRYSSAFFNKRFFEYGRSIDFLENDLAKIATFSKRIRDLMT